jgi:translation initiation factor 2 alpha subunit (eIF-2alpha)
VKAVSTGRNNEVLILGVGATGRCKGVRGALKGGEKLLVQVDSIDPEMGLLEVTLVKVTEQTTN